MSRYDTVTQAALDYLSRPGWGNLSYVKPLEVAIEAKHPGAIERARARAKKARFEQKFIGEVPSWAKRYVAKYGAGSVRSLRIRQSRLKDHSSGHCWYGDGRLVVTFARDGGPYGEVERRAVVLHEIAHALAKWDQHGPAFYAEWHRLLRSEGLYRAATSSGRFVGVSSLRAAARKARTKRG